MSKHELESNLGFHQFARRPKIEDPFRISESTSQADKVDAGGSTQSIVRGQVSSPINSESMVVKPRENLGGDQHAIRSGLIFQARETGAISVLTDRQRTVINLIHPEEGLPLGIRKIGRQMSISREGVAKLRDKAYQRLSKEVPCEPVPVKKTPAMLEIEKKSKRAIEEILEDFVSRGFSMREIGEKLGKDHKIVGDWCRLFHVEVKPPSRPIRSTKIKDLEKRYRIPIGDIIYRKIWVQNKTPQEAAKDLGIKRDTLMKWAKASGVPTRSQQEAVKMAFEDPKKRKRVTRRTKLQRQKISESMKKYHQRRREENQPPV